MADAVTHLSLRHAPLSRSTRILWLLEEIGCAYSLETLPTDRTLDAVLHPLRPPALRDGEVLLHESGAMSEWLCETRATHLWRAPGSRGRAGWLDWLHFAETMVQHVARKKEAGRAEGLAAALGLLSDWLEGSDWLLSGFSGADCQVGYSVWLASQVESLEAYPVAAAYLERCAARPAFRAAFGGGDVRLS
jgi:glutathione S-transferase